MIGAHPIKQILLDTQAYWDHEGTPAHVRENFLKVIKCGTIALGAEIYASETESKLVFHTCTSALARNYPGLLVRSDPPY